MVAAPPMLLSPIKEPVNAPPWAGRVFEASCVDMTTPSRGEKHRLMLAAMDPANRPALSVVAPCYNEQEVLPEFLRRVGAVLDGIGWRPARSCWSMTARATARGRS